MIIEKLHKRIDFKIPTYWDEKRKDTETQVESNASMVVHNLLKDIDFKVGDDITVDVKVLIQRNG